MRELSLKLRRIFSVFHASPYQMNAGCLLVLFIRFYDIFLSSCMLGSLRELLRELFLTAFFRFVLILLLRFYYHSALIWRDYSNKRWGNKNIKQLSANQNFSSCQLEGIRVGLKLNQISCTSLYICDFDNLLISLLYLIRF